MICVISFFSARIQAHDPGLSYADIALGDQEIGIRISFAVRDLENLPLNPEKTVIDPEFQNRLLKNSVIRMDDQRIRGTIRSVSVVEDGLRLQLAYPILRGKKIHYRSNLIGQLAFGHRQIVTFRKNGKIMRTGILSAQNSELVFRDQPGSLWAEVYRYIREGVWHIWIGSDHILFLFSLLLPAAMLWQRNKWVPCDDLKFVYVQVLQVVTAFTLAHSITLALGGFGVVHVPSAIAESLIALSVIFAALNNILPLVRKRLWLVTFGFGLIHGFGFASVLEGLGLPAASRGFMLFGFNIGVELGQLAILAVLVPFIFVARKVKFYRRTVIQAASFAVIVISSVWMVERVAVISAPMLTTAFT